MDGELSRLQALLGELTQLYDQVLGTLELNRQLLYLPAWSVEVIAPWQTAAQAKGIQWQTEVPPDLPAFKADPLRLGQALGNLLSNALKFTPPGGKIIFSAGQDSEGVWIRVNDSGPGILQEEQEKIFIPFFRGSQGKRFAEGMGLGLSITRDLVHAHDGRIDLVSAPGQGSTFTIHLPLQGH
jgi:hypothetical protein